MSENQKVELYQDEAGEFRWRRWASSDIVAVSGEGYQNREDARTQAEQEAVAHGIAEFVDMTVEEA